MKAVHARCRLKLPLPDKCALFRRALGRQKAVCPREAGARCARKAGTLPPRAAIDDAVYPWCICVPCVLRAHCFHLSLWIPEQRTASKARNERSPTRTDPYSQHQLGLRSTRMTLSPRRKSFEITLSFVTCFPSPPFAASVQNSRTPSSTLRRGGSKKAHAGEVSGVGLGSKAYMLQWRSKAFTRASNLWLLRKLMSTCSLLLTACINKDRGPLANSSVSSCDLSSCSPPTSLVSTLCTVRNWERCPGTLSWHVGHGCSGEAPYADAMADNNLRSVSVGAGAPCVRLGG